jgi:uncharacterized protein YggE
MRSLGALIAAVSLGSLGATVPAASGEPCVDADASLTHLVRATIFERAPSPPPVVLDVQLDAGGAVRDVRPLSAGAEVAPRAIEIAVLAARASTYQAATQACRPVPATVRITVPIGNGDERSSGVTVTVVSRGAVLRTPDAFRFQVPLGGSGNDRLAAAAAVDAAVSALERRLADAGVPASALAVGSLMPFPDGAHASRLVTVTLPATVDPVPPMTAALGAETTSLIIAGYVLADPSSAQDDALAYAFADATNNAQAIADAAHLGALRVDDVAVTEPAGARLYASFALPDPPVPEHGEFELVPGGLDTRRILVHDELRVTFGTRATPP